jgi:hypothetical protein
MNTTTTETTEDHGIVTMFAGATVTLATLAALSF